jgi:hypothetical protein
VRGPGGSCCATQRQALPDRACTRVPCAGRPFEARNKPKGSSFTGDDKDFLRFRLGQGLVIPAWEEAIASMKVGRGVDAAACMPGVRRLGAQPASPVRL